MKNKSALHLSVMGLLIAVGIVIPMFSPIKIVLEPASFTLASHVAIFIAMYLSPAMAAAVAVGTTAGFFLGGFPIVIVARAATHLIFSTCGAYYLYKTDRTKLTGISLRVFSLLVGLVHGLSEILVVSLFFYDGNMGAAYYQKGYLVSVLLLVGLGTVAHSMIDFEIAHVVVLALQNQRGFQKLTNKA